MFVRRYQVDVTTESDGTATAYSDVVNGRIISIQYEKDDFADGVDFTITTETTGQNLWTDENVNASAQRAPRQPTHANDGSASLYAAGGEPVEDYYAVDNERIKIVIAEGGNAKSGTFYITIG